MVLFIIESKFLLICLYFNFVMSFSDKHKYNINEFIKLEINNEYNICGIWYVTLYLPLSIYIYALLNHQKIEH